MKRSVARGHGPLRKVPIEAAEQLAALAAEDAGDVPA